MSSTLMLGCCLSATAVSLTILSNIFPSVGAEEDRAGFQLGELRVKECSCGGGGKDVDLAFQFQPQNTEQTWREGEVRRSER